MKFPILITFFLFTTFYILHSTYYIPIVSAQNCTTDTRVTSGLITTPSITGKFGVDSTGKCIASNQTSFAPFKIPSYADLKSIYYTQSKAVGKISPIDNNTTTYTTNPALITTTNTIKNYSGSIWISNGADSNSTDITSISPGTNDLNYTYTGAAIIFVDGGLSIFQNIIGTSGNGLVFIVGADVVIDKLVTRIDATIISAGTIYTAGTGGNSCTTSSVDVGNSTKALTINGSLVSLDSGEPPVFCRNLTGADNNSYPAEKIVQQPKYLVILRDLFSDTLQKWSEVQ